jgi:hypothetical protein
MGTVYLAGSRIYPPSILDGSRINFNEIFGLWSRWTELQKTKHGKDISITQVLKNLQKDVALGHQFPGSEGSLGFVFDILFTVPIEMYIVEQGTEHKNVLHRDAREVKPIIVTLRSNHVSPGWKFNLETVEWYIDDINLTLRAIQHGHEVT